MPADPPGLRGGRRAFRAFPSARSSGRPGLPWIALGMLIAVSSLWMVPPAPPPSAGSPVPSATLVAAPMGPARAAPEAGAPSGSYCAIIYTGICVSMANSTGPDIIPRAPSLYSSTQPNASDNMSLYVKSANPLNWSNAPHAGSNSPLTLNVTGILWNGAQYYSLYDGTVWHSSSLSSYWTGPIETNNISYPWWYTLNITALGSRGANFFAGMSITWWVYLSFNQSGKIKHYDGTPRFHYGYRGAWPYSPEPGAVQYAGKNAFPLDLTARMRPGPPNFNDTVQLEVNLTAADRSTGARIGGGYVDLESVAPNGTLYLSTTLPLPALSGAVGSPSAVNVTVPPYFARVAGARVSVTFSVEDQASDWIFSPAINYSVNGNGSFTTGFFADDLILWTGPQSVANATNSTPVVGPGVPIHVTLVSRNAQTALEAAQIRYTAVYPGLGVTQNGSIPLSRNRSTNWWGAIPGYPLGSHLTFSVVAWDFLNRSETSPTFQFVVPDPSTVLPTIPGNDTFFLVAVHDAGQKSWVSGANVTISALSGFLELTASTQLGVTYANVTGSPFVPILLPANASYRIRVHDPGFVPAGLSRSIDANVTFRADHAMQAHEVLAVNSNYYVVQSGNLILFWLNATTPGAIRAPTSGNGPAIVASLGLIAAVAMTIPVWLWWRRLLRIREAEMKRVTL